jgi:SM-20-related protein
MILNNDYFYIDNFLSEYEISLLFDTIEENKENFQPTKTSTEAVDYRKSFVLAATFFPELYDAFKSRLKFLFPTITFELAHPDFDMDSFEMQLTATNDGGFYKTHNDSGHPASHKRELTYVYYFNRKPKKFKGGQLQLYKTNTNNESLELPDSDSTFIEPVHNRIIFFDSRLMHQVLPTFVESKDFFDSRFTINGWLNHK